MRIEKLFVSFTIMGILGFTALVSLNSIPRSCIKSPGLGHTVVSLDTDDLVVPRCDTNSTVVVTSEMNRRIEEIESWANTLHSFGPFQFDLRLNGKTTVSATDIEAETKSLRRLMVQSWLNHNLSSSNRMDLPLRKAVEDFLFKRVWGVDFAEPSIFSVANDPTHHVSPSNQSADFKYYISSMSLRGFLAKYLEDSYQKLSFLDRMQFPKLLAAHLKLTKFSIRPLGYESAAEFIANLRYSLLVISPFPSPEIFTKVMAEAETLRNPKKLVYLDTRLLRPNLSEPNPIKTAKGLSHIYPSSLNTNYPVKFGKMYYWPESKSLLKIKDLGDIASTNSAYLALTSPTFSEISAIKVTSNRLLILEATSLEALQSQCLEYHLRAAKMELTGIPDCHSLISNAGIVRSNPSKERMTTGAVIHLPSIRVAKNFGLKLDEKVLEIADLAVTSKLHGGAGRWLKLIVPEGAIPLFQELFQPLKKT